MKNAPLWLRIFAPIAVFAVVAGIWHVAVTAFDIPPVILPKPGAVLQAMWTARWKLLTGSSITLRAAGAGLLASTLVGCMIAILLGAAFL